MSGADVSGNYKGVMLCNRPAASAPSAMGVGPLHIAPTLGAPQFRPVGVPPEPIGLPPAKDNHTTNLVMAHEEAARRRAAMPNLGHENFLTKHRRWLSEMAKQKADLNEELDAAADAADEKRRRFKESCKASRQSGIPQGMHHSVASAAEPMTESTGETLPPRAAAVAMSAGEEEAPAKSAAPVAKAAAPKAKGGKLKPKWAMTEEEVRNKP